jgi:hypothetical protein
VVGCAAPALAQQGIDPAHGFGWNENCGWVNFATDGDATVHVRATYISGFAWGENIGWINLGAVPTDGYSHPNTSSDDYGVNIDPSGLLHGFAWGENVGWINFDGGGLASPPNPARLDYGAGRLRGYAWGENIGWINLDDSVKYVGVVPQCGSADFDCDGDVGTDADITAFFACLAGNCPPPPCSGTADFNGDGDLGTDADIEAFFRVLAGGPC